MRSSRKPVIGVLVCLLIGGHLSAGAAQETPSHKEPLFTSMLLITPQWEHTNLSSEQAMKADATTLARGYLELKYILNVAELARKGATVHTWVNGPRETIDSDNAAEFIETLTARLAHYTEAIEKRGYRQLAPAYDVTVDGEPRPVLVEQSGFTFTIWAGDLHSGAIVESRIAVERADNPEITWLGEATDETIVVTLEAVGISAKMVDPGTRVTFTRATAQGARFATAYGGRAASHYNRNDYAKATADADESIRLDPTFPLAYGLRAAIRATCPDAQYRDGPGAVEDARRYCEFREWNDWEGLALLAAAYAENGDFERAVKWAEKAVGLTPDECKKEVLEQLELHRSGQPYHRPDGGR